jgi:hypothetical protein
MIEVLSFYQLVSCYIGKLAPYELWDKYASTNGFEFWENHALIFGSEEIIFESKTYVYPWVLNQPAICRFTPFTKPLREKEQS